MRFSEREGLKPVRSAFQVESVDENLKNGLWSAIYGYLFERWTIKENALVRFFEALWLNHYKLPIDRKPTIPEAIKYTRNVTFTGDWWEIYDLLEFITENFRFESPDQKNRFIAYVNYLLEREMSAYRIVGGRVSKLTTEEEIGAVEKAVEAGDRFAPVATHIRRALELLSDRKNPDYRNSIKESISAVESMCAIITGDPKATLGQALKQLADKGVNIHPALRDAYSKVYGYTSNAEGIRHALLDEETLDFEDAKFMLVSCSAFVNLLKARSA